MKVIRKVVSIGLVTLLALAYVHQHVELVKMSYVIQYNEKRVAKLIDRNERLGYNIANLEDPSRLEEILRGQKIDIAMPRKGQIVNVSQISGEAESSHSNEAIGWKIPGRFLEFLGLRAEAQAKEKNMIIRSASKIDSGE